MWFWEALGGAGLLVLLGIWRDVSAGRRAQEQAAGWLKYLANKGQKLGGD